MARTTDPFREMERLMNNSVLRTAANNSNGMDLYRKGDAFIAQLDLPGVDPSTIDIDIDDRTLTVRAERKPIESDVKWLVRERATGTFARQLTLGQDMALDQITADFKDGVLTLTMPVAEESKPRKISVSVTAESEGNAPVIDSNDTQN